jgi:hypothetical protein
MVGAARARRSTATGGAHGPGRQATAQRAESPSASPIDMGIFEGRVAIRDALQTWWEVFPGMVTELDEVRDLGNGVVFQAVTQRGRLADSSGEIHQRSARVVLMVQGQIETLTSYNNIDDARTAAERLAREWG